MKSLKTHYDVLEKCLATLAHSLNVIEDPQFNMVYEELRDSVIKRFK